MKVVNIVLNNFTNDSRVQKTSEFLSKNGFEVTVACLHEGELPEFEKKRAVNVHRLKLKSRNWSKNKVIQLIKYFEFMWRVVRRYRSSDVCHCNDLNALPVGVMIKLMNRRCKVVYDAHEYEINDIPYQSRASIKVRYFLERFLIRFADEVITVSDSIAHAYAEMYQISKPHLVLNCPPYKPQEKQNLFRKNLNIRPDQTIFLYQGGLGRGRGIEILLQAFESMQDQNNVLVCMGYGPLGDEIKQKASVSENIFFHPAVSPMNLLPYTASADFGISFIEDACLSYRYCLPNKMFEYLMAGVPIVTSNLFEMQSFVEKHQCGVFAYENTVEGFKSAIKRILMLNYETLLANVKATNSNYNWEKQELILSKIYQNVRAEVKAS